MGAKINLTNKRFGRLIVIKENGIQNGSILWSCLCDCGNNTIVNGNSLRWGNTKSCGCLIKENNKNFPNKKTHDKTNTDEYFIWKHIKGRCLNKNIKEYIFYGGRGITICEEWKNSFDKFFKHIGKKPFSNAQLDRIDNNGNYELGNVRWVTPSENCNNRRTTILLSANNKTLSIADWAKELEIKYGTLYMRLKNGWSINDCIKGERNAKNNSFTS